MATNLTSTQVVYGLLIGVVPSFFWLLIWLRTDHKRPEPLGLLMLCFVLGGVSVLFATVLQQATKDIFTEPNTRVMVWASIEEILKFGVFYLLAYKTVYNDEAIDPAIYLITIALGFAALENIFYILKPAASFNLTASLLTGSLRFFGSTLLHTISSCFIGIVIGLSARRFRGMSIVLGLSGAIFLHATFNFFILKNDTASFMQIYGYLWVAAIISHLILEKLRRIPPSGTLAQT
jgi:protease PrsW